ncbi:lytic transglycosylase domain-containing protein [Acinetobacter seifertii]|uniref:Lytic transglycosylase domain-containing protein n=1 Tax=Acinetobacter seifertii TaxID=1530123 RepID=A0A5E9PM33_9GAMM|nr:lytic transglycosylase domain-containing protein [Acinetobacter seifertii]TEU25495.1 lytic transglycosylase domain-containing protein [Acinetobacter seifertii]
MKLHYWFCILLTPSLTQNRFEPSQLHILGLKFFITFLMIIMTGCTSLGPNSGSFTWRSNKLSSGLQKAYSVPSSTANRLSPMIIQSADKYNVPPLLLAAVIRQESNYNSNARSPTGAVGLTQIIPSYWQQTCVGNLYDEYTNIQCGAYILNHYYQTADSWFKATAYYNVGPTGYERSFWTRHKAKKYARSIKHHQKNLKSAL